jgi:RNA polymerase sigma factor (TIGR02999 family)
MITPPPPPPAPASALAHPPGYPVPPPKDVAHHPTTANHPEAWPADELLPLVYTELRRLARSKLTREPAGRTLQATALVHEVYLKLARDEKRRFNGTSHFLAVAAEAMRRILVDQARRRKALRRGGEFIRVELADHGLAAPARDDQLLDLDEALQRLAEADPIKAEVVKLRYFVGLSITETAEVLGVSEPTAKRYWSYARAWLGREMKRHQNGEGCDTVD